MRCVACGDGDIRIVADVVGYVAGPRHEVAGCTRCGTRSVRLASDTPEGLYDAIYRQADRLPGYNRYVALAEMVRTTRSPLHALAVSDPAYWAVRSVLGQRRARGLPTRTLEVGSGLGYLTAALRRDGVDATGIDVSAAAVADATARFGAHFERVDVTDPGMVSSRYDVIVGLEIIEHLPDPRAFVAALRRWLNPGGSLVISTPNRDACSPDLRWATDLPPVHLHWFTERGALALTPPESTAELFDFTRYNMDVGPRTARRTREGWDRAVLDEQLRVIEPVPLAEPALLERVRRHRAVFPLVVGLHRTRYALGVARDLLRASQDRHDVDPRRTHTMVVVYSHRASS
jgi:SAM-dependent methyltransferase